MANISLPEVMNYIRNKLKAPDAVYSPTTKTIYVSEKHHEAIKNKFPELTIKLKNYD